MVGRIAGRWHNRDSCWFDCNPHFSGARIICKCTSLQATNGSSIGTRFCPIPVDCKFCCQNCFVKLHQECNSGRKALKMSLSGNKWLIRRPHSCLWMSTCLHVRKIQLPNLKLQKACIRKAAGEQKHWALQYFFDCCWCC